MVLFFYVFNRHTALCYSGVLTAAIPSTNQNPEAKMFSARPAITDLKIYAIHPNIVDNDYTLFQKYLRSW